MTNQEVIKNLLAIRVTEMELKDAVIEAFEDYEYNGIAEILVVIEESVPTIVRAYANHNQSPIFVFEYKLIDGKTEIKSIEIH